jgi:hypothetical protein
MPTIVCAAFGAEEVTITVPCDLAYSQTGRDGATAVANAASTVRFQPNDVLSLDEQLGASASASRPTPPAVFGQDSYASASTELHLHLTTPGRVRPGVMRLNWQVSSNKPYDGAAVF